MLVITLKIIIIKKLQKYFGTEVDKATKWSLKNKNAAMLQLCLNKNNENVLWGNQSLYATAFAHYVLVNLSTLEMDGYILDQD